MIKIEKSNNPAAVGALVLVLVLIVGRIVWMVFGHTEAASAASPASTPASIPSASAASDTQSPAVAVATPAQAAKPHPPAAVPTSTRNPFVAFVRPVSAPTHPDSLPLLPAGAHRIAARGGDTPLEPLPPMPFQVAAAGSGGGAPPSAAPRTPGPLPALPPSAGKQSEPAPALKLTAIIDGAEPMALVQTSNPQPVTLHVGDLIEGMRVTAIHEQEVVFARGTGFWTLPLQSAVDTVVGSAPVTTAPVTTVAPDTLPAISVATPEDNTDEKH